MKNITDKKKTKRSTTLPNYLKSELRIFFTVDIVGSTAYKQSMSGKPAAEAKKKNNGASDAQTRRSQLHPPWFAPISEFYQAAQQFFQSHWIENKAEWVTLGIDAGDPPVFWKAIGDEIGFSKVLEESTHVLYCLEIWSMVLKDLRLSLKRHSDSLDVKSTAWLAGFPITNTEVVLGVDVGKSQLKFEDDDFVFHSLESLKILKSGSAAHAYLDFIGPSIDTGFRLSSFSTPRKLALSLELAYIYADVVCGTTKKIKKEKVLKIYFHGLIPLRGLLGGRPYPVFWIDLDHAISDDVSELNELEEKLTGHKQVEPKDVKEFCTKFIEKHSDFISTPYISAPDGTLKYGAHPKNHSERIDALKLVVKWFDNEVKSRESQEKDISSSEEFSSTVKAGGEKLEIQLGTAFVTKLKRETLA
jgi:hypothetical protein